MTIGEIILTTNTNELSKVDTLEIGYDNANRIVIDFDLDTVLNRYTRKNIVEYYIKQSILFMVCI